MTTQQKRGIRCGHCGKVTATYETDLHWETPEDGDHDYLMWRCAHCGHEFWVPWPRSATGRARAERQKEAAP